MQERELDQGMECFCVSYLRQRYSSLLILHQVRRLWDCHLRVVMPMVIEIILAAQTCLRAHQDVEPAWRVWPAGSTLAGDYTTRGFLAVAPRGLRAMAPRLWPGATADGFPTVARRWPPA